jgi:hypothetical protein
MLGEVEGPEPLAEQEMEARHEIGVQHRRHAGPDGDQAGIQTVARSGEGGQPERPVENQIARVAAAA